MELEHSESQKWKRLQFCPKCDYELTGLPTLGNCPECGRPYDQSVLVLRGVARGAFSSILVATRRLGWRGVLLGAVGLAWIAFDLATTRSLNPYVACPLCFAACLLVFDCWANLSASHDGHAYLWVADEGIGQAGDGDPSAWSSKIRPRLPQIYNIQFIIVIICSPWFGKQTLFVVLLCIMSFILLAIFFGRSRVKIARAATEVSPELIAWQEVESLKFEPVRVGCFRVTAQTRKRFPDRIPIADIELEITGEVADQFCHHIHDLQMRDRAMRAPVSS